MTSFVLGWVLFSAFAATHGDDLSSEFSNSAALDESSTVLLYWSVDVIESSIHFAVQAKTTGWVGFGISSGQGKMKGADIVIGWVKDGSGHLSDRHGEGYYLPAEDASQDYELTGYDESDGKTTLKFKRKFDTCDVNDNKIPDATVKVIFAYHHSDPSSPDVIPKHTVMGARSLMLLNVKTPPKLPDNLKYFDLLNNEIKVPTNDTTYWCTAFKIPEFKKKHHIVKMEPIIQESNKGVVHHILVFHCPSSFPPNNVSHSARCFSPDMPPAILKCTFYSVFYAWAIGGSAFYLPEHVGFPLGTDDSPKYVVMQMHYDNPDMRADILDSSGFRFYYTEDVREYDAGTLFTGAFSNERLIIPPRQSHWDMSGHCPAVCTREGMKHAQLPGGGVHVFAVLLHTHLAGRAVRVRHIRDGVELPEIARDDNYDFNFQEFQVLRKEIMIKPGDELATRCSYDTTDRSKTTLGGESTREEMCLSFVMYYPKISLSKCLSSDMGSDTFYWRYFNYIRNVSHPRRELSSAKWNQSMVNYLRDSFRNSKRIRVLCVGQPGQTVFYKEQSKPVISKPYKPRDVCASVESGAKRAALNVAMFLVVLVLAAFVKF